MVQTIGRYAISFVSAGAVVFTLFYMMQFLIATADRTLDDESAGSIMEFVRVPEPEVIRPKEPPKKPPPPDEPPPEPPPPQLENLDPTADSISVASVNVNTAIDMDTGGFQLANDGEYLP
ncbi:MAG: hypothetical protein HKN08_03365, partial [Gammaproteobacteria bacterium]|nr:hypothetical protein [Gammaproteobacteria bacterium]